MQNYGYIGMYIRTDGLNLEMIIGFQVCIRRSVPEHIPVLVNRRHDRDTDHVSVKLHSYSLLQSDDSFTL